MPYAQLAGDVRKDLRVLAASRPIQNQYWLVNGHMEANQRQRLQNALLQFGATPEGRKYLASRSCSRIRRTTPGELKAEDGFAREVRKLLEPGV